LPSHLPSSVPSSQAVPQAAPAHEGTGHGGVVGWQCPCAQTIVSHDIVPSEQAVHGPVG
jgi:hypothetical protein